MQAVDFRDAAYWSSAEADIREKLLFFREMLRACLHPSLTNRIAGDILQTMQEALSAGKNTLQQTPLFADAAGLLSVSQGGTCDAVSEAERLSLPFQTQSDALLINTLPIKDAKSVNIICTSVADYIQVASKLSASEIKNIGLADVAASPLFLYELTQPDLFHAMAANEKLVRQIASRKYAQVIAELPRKKHLSGHHYTGRNFLATWFQSIERLIHLEGSIVLIADDRLLTHVKFQPLRIYLAARFRTLQVYRINRGGKIAIFCSYKGDFRNFYCHFYASTESLIVTSGGEWLAASEQAFFEGMPLVEVLNCNYKLQKSDDQLLMSFDLHEYDWEATVTDMALQYFKAHYKFEERYEQEQARLVEAAQGLTNIDDLLQCRLHPELVQELRRWVQWAESKDAIQLVKKIEKPDYNLSKQFATIARLFADIHRKFERMGAKAALDKESMSVIEYWFDQRLKEIAVLEAFFGHPDFDAPAYTISKADVFYYTFALVQSKEYLAACRFLLRHYPPRIYPVNDFRAMVEVGKQLWKQYMQPT